SCSSPTIRLCDPVRACPPVFALYPTMRLPSPLTAPSVLPLPLRMLTLQPVKNTSVPTCEAHGSETAPNCVRLSGVSFFLHAARTTTTPDFFAQSTVAPADATHVRQSAPSPTAQRVRFMGGSSLSSSPSRRGIAFDHLHGPQ